MATERVNKPPSLPPYPEMIFAAIDELKNNEGLNKSLISNFIGSKYGDVPAGHMNLLTEHLKKLKDSGELVFVKNKYMRPDPNLPLKRGRGRPPKAKDPGVIEAQDQVRVGSDAGLEVKRGRGRPKKDTNVEPVAKKVKVSGEEETAAGRPRGRPRKVDAGAEMGGAEVEDN